MGYIDVDWDKIGRDAIKPLDTVSTAHLTRIKCKCMSCNYIVSNIVDYAE